MVKPEKFSHLHLVNHFTIPLGGGGEGGGGSFQE